MNKDLFKQIGTLSILLILLVLSFFLLKPILLSILFGLILAILFFPVYDKLGKAIKHRGWRSALICLLFAAIIVIPLWFLTPALVQQSIKIFMASQEIDFVTPLKNIFPALFSSEQFGSEIGSVVYSFVTNITNSIMNTFSKLILNFPTMLLQLLVVFFVLFFALKDNKKLISYLQSLLPFSKDLEKKLFKSSKDLTFSVLYGQVLLGIVQGIIVGIGFFAFGVENALFLTIIAALAGIFPILGTAIVWVPVVIFMAASGDSIGAIVGVVIFGFLSSIMENLIKPLFVAHRTKVHSSVILLGMVGGLFFFGIIGIILGPLVLSYLLILLEIYRNKKSPGLITEPSKS